MAELDPVTLAVLRGWPAWLVGAGRRRTPPSSSIQISGPKSMDSAISLRRVKGKRHAAQD